MKKSVIVVLFLLAGLSLRAARQPEYSTAGFFELENTGRTVYSMNPAWRFFKGPAQGAEAADFDDEAWTVVSLPNGIEYLPTEASGCVNYQGEIWYRKHFVPDEGLQGKKLFLYFEAIMGKSRVYVNGALLAEHFGGYLPIVVDVTDALQWGQDNVIAVWADNSDDPSYPPGKAQDVLDFTYCGGIYRDCWLVAHNHVFITDPNYENEVAGGGLFVCFGKVQEDESEVRLQLQVRNDTDSGFVGKVEYTLLQTDGTRAAGSAQELSVLPGKTATATDLIVVESPHLWSPSSPYLYSLQVRILDKAGNVVDGYRQRVGIRSIEFRGKDGFWLNGKPYGKPLIGGNRHQDYAVVGNAVANSAHYRDALKLRKAGMEMIRNAHCPQDPAFMDACDELGLLMIDNTPGWQFWNDDPVFAERVYSDIRNLVRRDRNHACVWLWEPILNETWYPDAFAKNVHDIVDEEYPYPYCYSGCDSEARGHEYFPVNFAHPFNMYDGPKSTYDSTKTYFTREWGDNVDDWSSHNSTSRVARNWGEQPMKIQAWHYANPDYPVTSYDVLYRQPAQLVGGALWHSFDHQRGYHPDPFYGGLMDVFRQPKYSYYMFMSQRPAVKDESEGSGPMVFIANAMTPFSGKDVTVYSNCDEVRLTFCDGGEPLVYKKDSLRQGMPSPPIVFKDVYDFMVDKDLSMHQRQDEVYLLAEGLMDGEVVATHRVTPARRPERILLWADNEGMDLKADGSDFVTVIAAVADRNGEIKRLNNYNIIFTVEGEGRLLGDSSVLANPVAVRWGTAPFLLQSTLNPGKIRITAKVLFEGSQMPLSGTLELESVPTDIPLIYNEEEAAQITSDSLAPIGSGKTQTDLEQEVERLRKELNELKLKEVSRQQTEFGEVR